MEGYPKAAAKFSKEANLSPQPSNSSISLRQQIQTCIHTGKVQSAIEMLNDFDPEVRAFLIFTPSLSPFAMIRFRVVHAPLILVFGSLMRTNHFYMSKHPIFQFSITNRNGISA